MKLNVTSYALRSASNLSQAESNGSMMMDSVAEDEESGYLGDQNEGESETDHKMLSADESQPEEIAKKETQMVNYSKVLVIAVIFIVATLIGVITFLFVRGKEKDDYKNQYENVVNEIISTSQLRARTIFDNLETLAVSLTSQAIDLDMEWPFCVFPQFQVQGMLSNQVTGADTLTIHPIVYHAQREAWEKYSVANQGWIARGHLYDKEVSKKLYEDIRLVDVPPHPFRLPRWNESGISPFIATYDERWNRVEDWDAEFYVPLWQRAPAEDFAPNTNINLGHVRNFERFVRGMMRYDQAVLTRVSDGNYLSSNYDKRFAYTKIGPPHSYLFQPIYDTLFENRTMVAFLNAFLRWDNFFLNVLPDSEEGIMLVIDGTCNQTYTFQLNGKDVVFLNDTDLHDVEFEGMRRDFEFAPFAMLKDAENQDEFCQYSARIYPSKEWKSQFFTNDPYTYAFLVIGCFILTTSVFVVYDVLVQRRQTKVMETANKTNAIVTSLFPSNVRNRLMEEIEPAKEEKPKNTFLNTGTGSMSKDITCVEDTGIRTSEKIFGSKPIADLFTATTIMFADMVGFTAWSSVREPTQVFTLLETIYYSFDSIARRRRVFKVETIGDCYVAVCGLPMPRKDHGVVMARFAQDCVDKMNELCHELETTLGPDTADLCMRVGLHSGPVTAGVSTQNDMKCFLPGTLIAHRHSIFIPSGSRAWLLNTFSFGDTMNTASRMESTGEKNKIQISRETADLLIAAGKGKWLTPRADKPKVKGKGEMETFWLRVFVGSAATTNSGDTVFSEFGSDEVLSNLAMNHPVSLDGSKTEEDSAKTQRLVNWNVDILSKILKQILARRSSPKSWATDEVKELEGRKGPGFDEVKDIVALPQFDASSFRKLVDPASIKLSRAVQDQLLRFVTQIARSYRNDNPFHNFEHASHVTMSVTKLLSRVVNPIEMKLGGAGLQSVAEDLHDYTFGITSDPLTHFACVISALIHDIDHPGVSNAVLVEEKDPMAVKFNNRSVAEQNSVCIAWDILMQREYRDLRACIYSSQDECQRFRQIIVNIVLATDIMDKELGALRRARWEKAFSGDSVESRSAGTSSALLDVNRKATIVLEHLIQASDVAHTMQHWHVYRKWNERLFREVYKAYIDGRTDKDPSEGWYQGEIGFFDYYIIPLAKKLETCGVFGVSSDEYLNYAEHNRNEWVEKGEAIVQGYLSAARNSAIAITEEHVGEEVDNGVDC